MSHQPGPPGQPPTAHDETVRPNTPDVVRVLVDHHRQFLSFLERRTGNKAVAEDLLQEAFARGVERIETLRDDESVVAWFYRALRNAVIDHHRRQQAASRAMSAFAQELETAPEPPAEVRDVVCRCVSHLATTLKPEYADALQRIEVEGASVKQFADERGISTSNAGVRVFRAREALRRQVARSCGTCAEHGCLDCTCGPPGKAC
jgi:RNA polymerase sigma-70 factor (ECF subfamily)